MVKFSQDVNQFGLAESVAARCLAAGGTGAAGAAGGATASIKSGARGVGTDISADVWGPFLDVCNMDIHGHVYTPLSLRICTCKDVYIVMSNSMQTCMDIRKMWI